MEHFPSDHASSGGDDQLYAPPRVVTDLSQCSFYHTVELPGYGVVNGPWDLRKGLGRYLGGVAFGGKRVLEVGTASGCLCFHMEALGADVVAYDLCERHDWDLVPLEGSDYDKLSAQRRQNIRKLNNSWWLSHRAHGSRARVVYGTAYAIPRGIGPVDVATLCCVLLHLRDPFQAVARAAAHARERVVVVDVMPPGPRQPRVVSTPAPPPGMAFLPDSRGGGPLDAWWRLSPELVCRFLRVVGFDDAEVTSHEQQFNGRPVSLFTVVARRTRGRALAA